MRRADLPIALGLMGAIGAIPADALDGCTVLGELGLDGTIATVAGVLPAAIGANGRGEALICPAACGPEAAWASPDMAIVAAGSLIQLSNHFKGTQVLARPQPKIRAHAAETLDLADIKGQESGKRALEIAAAGGLASALAFARRCLPHCSSASPKQPFHGPWIGSPATKAGARPGSGRAAATMCRLKPFQDPDNDYVPPRRSDGTIQTRRIQQPWPADRPFRVLSIDGGGICGILPAAVLAELERRFLGGRSIASDFDLIAGTSTGGIIALGLAHGLTARQVLDVYVERSDYIFPPASRLGRLLRFARRIGRTAYDRRHLEEELLRIFGEATLGEAKTRLVIPAFEGRHGEPWLFKTPHHPDYKLDRVERMVRVELSTAAAPTYFEALPNNGYVMVDGGLWANNPVMNALVDTLACFDVDRGQVRILTLGCGETAFEVDHNRTSGGMVQWRKVIEAAMRAQSLNALGQAYLMVGKNNVLRIDAPQTPNPIALDDSRRARDELPYMARSLVEGAGGEIARLFLDEPAASYIPCPQC